MTRTADRDVAGTVEVVRDEEDLAPLEGEWRRHAEQRGNAFVTPEWFRCWLEHYGCDNVPSVAVVRGASGGLLGLLPLVDAHRRFVSVLRFAGANLGDVFEPVCLPEDDHLVADALGAFLRSTGRILLLDNVEGDWPAALLDDSRSLATTFYRAAPLPVATLAGRSGEEYLGSLSRNLRDQVRRKLAALERRHTVRFRLTDADLLTDDLATLFRLHDARWATRGGSSLASPRARRTLSDFAALALARGWLRLWVLEVDERTVAAWYGWRLGGRYAYYTAGFEPTYARYSPGLLLLVHTLRAAADEGADVYDFLLGGESYKLRLASGARSVQTILAAPASHPLSVAVSAGAWARRASGRLPRRCSGVARAAGAPLLRFLPTARAR